VFAELRFLSAEAALNPFRVKIAQSGVHDPVEIAAWRSRDWKCGEPGTVPLD